MLPLKDNEGVPIDRDTWRWWHDRLTSLVAGFTDLGVVSGWWRGIVTKTVNALEEDNAGTCRQ